MIVPGIEIVTYCSYALGNDANTASRSLSLIRFSVLMLSPSVADILIRDGLKLELYDEG